MNAGKFHVGHAYYQFSKPWEYRGKIFQNITTWIYAGHFPLDTSSTDCDVPYHFYVFHPCLDEDVLKRDPARGLKIPSLEGANMSMMTWDELAARLTESDGEVE